MTNPQLSGWENYYVIVGSSGAALLGLQFVVITLISGMRRRPQAETISAFGTPTVVHLTGALLVSAIMSAPWSSLAPASAALTAFGFGGLAYGVLVVRRARKQKGYKPVAEDWIWYLILPFVIYAGLAVSALLLPTTRLAPFGVAAAALGLLLIGIHNAWDTVTHLVSTASDEERMTE